MAARVMGPLMTTSIELASGGVRSPRTGVVGGSWRPANRTSPSIFSFQDRPVGPAKLIERYHRPAPVLNPNSVSEEGR
jgi:hypothetical protein